MKIMREESTQNPFAKLFQYGPESAGFLPVGQWQAKLVGWGELPFCEGKTPQEAWQKLSTQYGALTAHDEATIRALLTPT